MNTATSPTASPANLQTLLGEDKPPRWWQRSSLWIGLAALLLLQLLTNSLFLLLLLLFLLVLLFFCLFLFTQLFFQEFLLFS